MLNLILTLCWNVHKSAINALQRLLEYELQIAARRLAGQVMHIISIVFPQQISNAL
jgi:hypothetical protein